MELATGERSELKSPELVELRRAWTDWLRTEFEGRQCELVTFTIKNRCTEWVGLECEGPRHPCPCQGRSDGHEVRLPTISQAGRAFEKLGKRFGASGVRFFLVEERGTLRGRLHGHAIIAGDPLAVETAIAEWEQSMGFVGRSGAVQSMGALAYVVKYLQKASDTRWWAGGIGHES